MMSSTEPLVTALDIRAEVTDIDNAVTGLERWIEMARTLGMSVIRIAAASSDYVATGPAARGKEFLAGIVRVGQFDYTIGMTAQEMFVADRPRIIAARHRALGDGQFFEPDEYFTEDGEYTLRIILSSPLAKGEALTLQGKISTWIDSVSDDACPTPRVTVVSDMARCQAIVELRFSLRLMSSGWMSNGLMDVVTSFAQVLSRRPGHSYAWLAAGCLFSSGKHLRRTVKARLDVSESI